MLWIVVFLSSLLGSMVQTVTGFGAAVVIMAFLPHFMSILQAAPLSASVCLITNTVIILRSYKKIAWKKILIPCILYTVAGLIAIELIGKMNVGTLNTCFGIFLIVLALYYLFFAGKASLPNTKPVLYACSTISGVTCGIFSIGGPLMALGTLNVFPDHETYLASLQMIFFTQNFLGLLTRIKNGLYTAQLVPYSLLAVAAVFAGTLLGRIIARRLNAKTIKIAVYLLVLISGIVAIF